MPKLEIGVLKASEIDYRAYAGFQREAYRDLLDRTQAPDSFMTPEYYRWKYRTPDGEGLIAQVRQGRTMLSSSAMQPLRVIFNGKPLTAWHFMDVATLPEARRRGHLLATLRRLRDTVPAGDLMIAFPNAGSIGAFLKLGFVENVILTTWVNPWVRLAKKRCERVEVIDTFGAEHDIVDTRLAIDRPHLDRRPGYLNWRYTEHPNNRYAVFAYDGGKGCEGICVVRKVKVLSRDLALVMEILGSTDQVVVALLSHAADWAHAAGLGKMALMSTMLPFRTALRSFLAPVPSVLLPKRQVLVVRGAGEEPVRLMTPRWALQTGDWDVF